MPCNPRSPFNRAYILVKYGDTRLLEMFMGICSFVWGAYITMPFNVFFSDATIFSYLAQVVPEWLIGVILMIVGVLTATYSVSDNCKMRRISLLSNHLAWTFIFVFALTHEYINPSLCTYAIFSVTLMYLFLKAPICRK